MIRLDLIEWGATSNLERGCHGMLEFFCNVQQFVVPSVPTVAEVKSPQDKCF